MTSAASACAIQPAGFLLALSENWSIEAVSANIGEFVHCNAVELIGCPASIVLADDAIHALRNRLALLRDPDGVERLLACRLTQEDRGFDVSVQFSGGLVVIEAEPATAGTYGDMTATLRGMVARIDNGPDLAGLLGEAAQQLRALTGFDRVLILRFDHDWSSRVVAEYARGGVASLLGERIAQDSLPLEERECLQRAPLHLSGDFEAELVPVLYGAGCEPPDLTRAVLRPLTPAYREQLSRMGARAAMSISLIVGGSLWGVVACLHHHPRSPGFERRSVADLFSQLLASRIEIVEMKAALAGIAGS